jgi:hypothetical protein
LPDDGLDYAAMQTAINESYTELGQALGVTVAHAGQAWAGVLRLDPATALWEADGSHPSEAGTYLAACVLYARLFHRSPVGLSDTEGLSPSLAATLQTVADQL